MRLRAPVIVAAVALLVGAAFVVDHLVVTDREAVFARVEGAFTAAKSGDAVAFADSLDDAFAWEGSDKAGAVERIRGLARTYPTSAWRLTIDEVTLEGDRASVRVHVTLAASGGFRADARIGLAKRGGAWRIDSVAQGERPGG